MGHTSLPYISLKLSLITFETGFLDPVGRMVVLGAVSTGWRLAANVRNKSFTRESSYLPSSSVLYLRMLVYRQFPLFLMYQVLKRC